MVKPSAIKAYIAPDLRPAKTNCASCSSNPIYSPLPDTPLPSCRFHDTTAENHPYDFPGITLLSQLPGTVLDLIHHEIIYRHTVVIIRRIRERSSDAHETGCSFDFIAKLLWSEVCIQATHRFNCDHQRIVCMAREGVRRPTVHGFVISNEVRGHLVLLRVRTVAFGNEDLTGRKPEALTTRTGTFNQLPAGVSVAAEQWDIHLQRIHVFRHNRCPGPGRPHENGLGIGALDLRQLGGHVRVPRLKGLLSHDLDIIIGQELFYSSRSILREASGVSDNRDLADALALDVVQRKRNNNVVGPRSLEDPGAQRVGDRRATTDADVRDLRRDHLLAEGHGLSGPGRTDEGHDLLSVDQLAGCSHSLRRLSGIILNDDLQGPTVDAAVAVDSLYQHLNGVLLRLTQASIRTSQ